MPDLSIDFAGIRSPNPFWLASGPPTNTGDQVMRAFDTGWGGAVWKTLGNPIVNVSSRLAGAPHAGQRLMGLNNIELITDRSLADNFREIREVKRRYPDHAVIVSLMVETREEWHDIIRRSEDTGCDGLELNFGCPHGMCERGMGSAVGQEPRVMAELIRWVRDVATVPIIVKLTPNVSDIVEPGLTACDAGAHAVSLINTIQSIIGVDLDRLVPLPRVGDASSHGGYCGPAVKPIALRMVAELAREARFTLPISGIGGISTWRDAAEFLALGATSLQVCTAVMHHGYRIVEDLIEGLDDYLAAKNMASVGQLVGRAVPAFKQWGELDLNYHVVAHIDAETCIGCQVCYVACLDGAHQCIHLPDDATAPGSPAPAHRVPWVDEDACVGCNLCALVCPVDECITMVEKRRAAATDTWNLRLIEGRAHVPGGLVDLADDSWRE